MNKVGKQEPPDGGWGWCVVVGSSLIQLFTRSIEPSFGLLFGDLLKELGVGTTGAAIITSTLDATINFSGFIVGPAMKYFTYRKVAFLGGFLSSAALLSTAFARSMTHIIITYGLLGGLGFGLSTSAMFVAVNIYFRKRRGQAIGLALAGSAMGFLTMPHVISYLLQNYDFKGTVIILGALSLNSLVGASLLQPVEWHMVTRPDEAEELNKTNEKSDECNSVSISLLRLAESPSKASLLDKTCTKAQSADNVTTNDVSQPRKRTISTQSDISRLDICGSTLLVPIKSDTEDKESSRELKPMLKAAEVPNIVKTKSKMVQKPVKENSSTGLWKSFVILMDFDLLLSLSFLNVLYGVSIAYIGEMNFKLIMPFFLSNLGYSKSQIAQALSVMAISDIAARIIIPPIVDRISYSRKQATIVGLVLFAIVRSVLAEQTSWPSLLMTMLIHGFFRGFAIINLPLVISEAVPPEKFPAAFGLSRVAKGIFIVTLGPLIGWIRDYTGSYSICLHAQSLLLVSCSLAWFIEECVTSKKTKKEKPKISELS